MFKLTLTTLFALFFLSATVSGALVPRRDPPKGWWTAGLEVSSSLRYSPEQH